jgi:hypothetical protein
MFPKYVVAILLKANVLMAVMAVWCPISILSHQGVLRLVAGAE